MLNEDYIINTSICDARINLEHIINTNPQQVKQLAEKVLEKLKDSEGHKTRRQMVAAMLKKANKLIGAS
ncbi:hypothetical protein [Shewanella sp. S23-S33]|uniref:hypothetical protein n=1 Tax=Shewanella sp. S23-S33 TaxID=3342769 RepID=UPI00372D55B1